MRLRAFLLMFVAGCVTPPEAGTQPLTNNVVDWRDEIVYQLVTDRFANGDASNDWDTNLDDPSAYHGGDWRGVIDRLDYLEALGVTAIWISPVVKNVESDAGFASYHGYWTQDFEKTNPHFGDFAALREMVDAAHAHGIKVILDVVTNHVGQAFYYDINKNGQPDEFYIGQGGEIVPLDQADPTSDLVRLTEWDPDFSAAGIQSWTSLGPSGAAPVVFTHDPAINREPPQPAIFAQPYAYHRKGRVTVWTHPEVCSCPSWGCDWDDPCRRQQELEGDFPGGLKDIDTTRQDVRDALVDVFARWIDIGDFDGFRIDTLKHVERDFWEDFAPRIRRHAWERGKDNFFLFGEAFDGDDRLLGSYTQGEGIDSVFYFSEYYTVVRGALLGDGSRTCEIGRLHCRRYGCAGDPCLEGESFAPLYDGSPEELGPVGEDGEALSSRQLVVSFLSNHDVGRFRFFMPHDWPLQRQRVVMHQALLYLMTTDGIPSLYYGVEQEFAGGNDPANRETLWDPAFYQESVGGDVQPRRYDSNGDGVEDTAWRPYDTGNPTFRWLRRLIRLRKENVALRRGGLVTRWATAGSGGEDYGLYAFERRHPQQTAVVVLNLASSQTSVTRGGGSTMVVGFPAGTMLRDLLSDDRFPVQSGGCPAGPGEGCVAVDVPARGGRVLVAE